MHLILGHLLHTVDKVLAPHPITAAAAASSEGVEDGAVAKETDEAIFLSMDGGAGHEEKLQETSLKENTFISDITHGEDNSSGLHCCDVRTKAATDVN